MPLAGAQRIMHLNFRCVPAEAVWKQKIKNGWKHFKMTAGGQCKRKGISPLHGLLAGRVFAKKS